MSFSINTNVASLSAQNYLRINSNFQGMTINRVTSGLRIVQSGDDAAGLAIANGYRSDQAVLTQGVRNANDGLSQLQIADGGMSNISQLLDRARTLATQSATGTFTGDRTVLNAEFQSVMGEIDRQSQAIGLNSGGTFAKALSVFMGGGKGTTASAVIANGSVNLDLSKSTVDTKGLGLSTYQALGNPIPTNPVDLGSTSSTSVKNILSTAAGNTTGLGGNTTFYFTGAGFSDPSTANSTATGLHPITVTANISAVTDTTSLVNAINTAIAGAANPTSGSTSQSTAFANAGITASVVTDSLGHQQIAFSSPNAAFQVQAGDQVANAFIGNFASTQTATGQSASSIVTGASMATNASFTAQNVYFRFSGLSQTGTPVTSASVAIGNVTLANEVAALNSTSGGGALGATIQGLGIKAYATSDNKLAFTGPAGTSFEVQVGGDKTNNLGFGNWAIDPSNNVTYSAITETAVAGAAATDTSDLTFAVGNRIVDLGAILVGSAQTTGALVATQIGTAISGMTNAADKLFLSNAGITAASVTGAAASLAFTITSSNGTAFRVMQHDATSSSSFGLNSNATVVGASATATSFSNYIVPTTINSGGVEQSTQFSDNKAYKFSDLLTAGNTQTLTFSGQHTAGSNYTTAVPKTAANAGSLDAAIKSINSQLQQTNDPELQKIYAVKEQDANGVAEGIRFMSPDTYSLKIGASSSNVEGVTDVSTGAQAQGEQLNAAKSAGAAVSDISNQTSAQMAVTSLSAAVKALGSAQAVVGRGENQFNYAVNLAQSQLTNLATAESRIRDADLAAEAANLTKAQVLMQAGVAALAQANSAPQQVLSLLR